jgi:mono/diheme cytochrome c family protein
MPQQPPRPTTARRAASTPPRWLDQRALIIGFAVLCALALIVFVVRSGGQPINSTIDRADPANVELVAQGRQLYITRCAGCHGSDLRGEPGWPQRNANGVLPASPLDGSGTAWQRDDRWLFTTIKDGGQATAPPATISAMPAFGGGLSDAEIWAVLSYLKSTWPAQLQTAQPQP